MKTAVFLVLVGLVVDSSYAWLINEDLDENQPLEDENRLNGNISLRAGTQRHFCVL